jgi:hypothetical protein
VKFSKNNLTCGKNSPKIIITALLRTDSGEKTSLMSFFPYMLFSSCLVILGWSEPAATNAPIEDETVEAVLGMNQKHILPAQNYLFFQPLFCPRIFPSYLPLPTYLILSSLHRPSRSRWSRICAHSIARTTVVGARFALIPSPEPLE